jgi:hypothetical protein
VERLGLDKGRSPSSSETTNTMVETLADLEGMCKDKTKHPGLIPLVKG